MPLGASCSTGLAQHEPGETVGDLLRRADAELYRAKHARPDPWQVAVGAR